jgi:hypothetical protein
MYRFVQLILRLFNDAFSTIAPFSTLLAKKFSAVYGRFVAVLTKVGGPDLTVPD